MRWREGLGVAAVCVASALPLLHAQVGRAQTPLKNLQVLPPDTPPEDVMIRMQIMTEALGVGCEYCHKYQGPAASGNDFAADDKPAKGMARLMMRWDQSLNEGLMEMVKKPADGVTRVRCITCHRGSAIPVTPPSPLRPGAR